MAGDDRDVAAQGHIREEGGSQEEKKQRELRLFSEAVLLPGHLPGLLSLLRWGTRFPPRQSGQR